ncbi:MAG: LPS export ABC transporter periplasmic protein LptC [Saprospiraceae bacterium]
MKLFFLFFLGILFFACDPEVKKITELDALKLVNKDLLKNIDLTYTDSGKIILNIKASEMLRFAKNNQSQDEFKKGLIATFYNNGLRSNILTANYALRVIEDGKTYLSDHVLLSNTKGEKLETSELLWDERNGRVSTDKFVKLTRDKEIVQGYGFDSDQNFTKGTIKSIEATFPANKIMSEDLNDDK